MELHIWGYKRSREFARRMACYRGEYPPGHPAFDVNSTAAVTEDPTPVSVDAPLIIYSEKDDDVIRDFVRKNGRS